MKIIKNKCLVSIVAAVCAFAAKTNAQDPPVPVMVLTFDAESRVLRFDTGIAGIAALAIGPAPIQPIQIGDISLEVVPLLVLPLGAVEVNQVIDIAVPAGVSGIGVEAVAIEVDSLRLHDSNTLYFEDVGEEPDLVESSFKAELLREGSPPIYSASISLTSPSGGYELLVDGVESRSGLTDIYLRLVEPGEGEIVLQVLEHHKQVVGLGSAISGDVHVHLLRRQRGAVGPEVYKRMAILQASSGPGAVK
jgi:hypothetical protein